VVGLQAPPYSTGGRQGPAQHPVRERDPAGHPWVRQTTATSTCVLVPADTAKAIGLCGLATQFPATPLTLRLWTPGLSPETITVCSYPGKTAGTNFGAAPSTPKLYTFGSKSKFLQTLTAKMPVETSPVLGAHRSLHADVSR